MRVAVWWLTLMMLAAPPIGGQSVAGDSFEVASVRASAPGGDGMTYFSPPGSATFVARNIPLALLVQLAYGLDPHQMEIPGKLGWMNEAEYDVSAKREGETAVSYEQVKPRLQKLLAERFHLVVHHETRSMKGYVLVVGKGGAKLTPSKGGEAHANILPEGLWARSMTLKDLASLLSRPAGRPVEDRTGVEGKFDLELKYAPATVVDSALPSVFTAVEEQLGLRLEPAKVGVDVVVVDSAERVPVEN